METWNPYGWMLLAGGFVCGMVIGGLGLGGWFWLLGYGLMLAGLTILMTNMVRALWRLGRRHKAILSRLTS